MSSNSEAAIFVLRFWQEPGAPGNGWRGQFEHVATGQRLPITDLERLRPLVEQHLKAVAEKGA